MKWEPEMERIARVIDRKITDARIVANETLVACGQAAPFITKSKAFKLYGRANVENWIKWKLLPEVKDGDVNTQVRLEVSRLIALSGKMHRCEFYTNERNND